MFVGMTGILTHFADLILLLLLPTITTITTTTTTTTTDGVMEGLNFLHGIILILCMCFPFPYRYHLLLLFLPRHLSHAHTGSYFMYVGEVPVDILENASLQTLFL